MEENFEVPDRFSDQDSFSGNKLSSDLLSFKQDLVKKSAARKKQVLSPGRLPDTLEDFNILNPQATVDDILFYQGSKAIQDKVDKITATEEAHQARNRNRTAAEILSDAATSVGVGVAVRLPQIAFGAADLASRAITAPVALTNFVKGDGFQADSIPSLDELTGLSPRFDEVAESANELLSDLGQFAAEEVKRDISAFDAAVERTRSSGTEIDGLVNTVEGFKTSVGAFVDNPVAAVNSAFESLPQLFVGGAAGKIAANSQKAKILSRITSNISGRNPKLALDILKTKSKALSDKFLKSKAGQKAVEKVASRAGLTNIAVSESFSNAVSAKGDILNLTHKELSEGSNLYVELLAQGKSQNQAKDIVSNKVFDVTAAITSITAVAAAKLSGAAKFEGNLFTKNSKVGNIVTNNIFSKSVGGVVTEGIEETLQGGTGELAANVGNKLFSDKSKELFSGVGVGAGSGLVVGSLSGGITTGVTQAPGTLAQGLLNIANKAEKSTAKINEELRIDKAVKAGDISKIIDTKDTQYNPESALIALEKSLKDGITDKDVSIIVNEMEKHLESFGESLRTKLGAALEKGDDKAVEALSNDLSRFKEYNELVTSIRSEESLTPEQVTKAIESIAKIGERTEEVTGTIERVLNSAHIRGDISVEQAEDLIKNGLLDEEETKQFKNYVNTRRAMEAAENADAVNKDILEGGKGNISIRDHQARIAAAVLAKDDVQAANFLNKFKTFASRNITRANAVLKVFNNEFNGVTTEAAQKLKESVKTKYGLDIHKGSNNSGLISYIQLEGKALRDALKESTEFSAAGRTGESVASRGPTASENEINTIPEQTSAVAQSYSSVAYEVSETNVSSSVELANAASEDGNIESSAVADASGRTTSVSEQSEATPEVGTPESIETSEDVKTPREVRKQQQEELLNQPAENLTVKDEIAFNKKVEKLGKVPLEEQLADLAIRINRNTKQIKETKSVGAKRKLQKTRQKLAARRVLLKDLLAKNIAKRVDEANSKKRVAKAKETVTDNTNREAQVEELAKTQALEGTQVIEDTNTYSLSESILDDTVENGKLKDNFDVRQNGEEGSNVLQSTRNFFTSLANNLDGLQDTLRERLSNAQFNGLTQIGRFAKSFQTALLVPKKGFKAVFDNSSRNTVSKEANRLKFRAENAFTLFLRSGVDDGTITDPRESFDENMIAQIAVVAYNWLATGAESSIRIDDNRINGILGKPNGEYVTQEAYALLGRVGDKSDLLEGNLGAEIFNALGLVAKPNSEGHTDGVLAPRLELALGQMALGALQEMGLVQFELIPSIEISKLAGNPFIAEDKATVRFVRPTTTTAFNTVTNNNEIVPSRAVEDIIKNESASEKVIGELFDVASKRIAPGFTEPTQVVQKVKRTDQDIPAKTKKILAKKQKEKNTLKEAVYNIFEFLSDDTQLETMGYVFDVDNTVNKNKRLSVEGSNAQIKKDIDNAHDFVKEIENHEDDLGRNSPFYFLHEIWKNYRVGMVGNVINTQASKIHRSLFGIDSHNVTLNIKDPGSKEIFYLSLAEALGIKMTNPLEKIIADMFTKTGTPEIQDAVAAIQKHQQGDTSVEVHDAIANGIEAGGEKMWSLDALVALATFDTAFNNGKDTIQTNLFREVDGVTNGTAIQLAQLAGAKDFDTLASLLEPTGFDFGNNTQGDHANHNEWLNTPGAQNRDAYQNIAFRWKNGLAKTFTELKNKALKVQAKNNDTLGATFIASIMKEKRTNRVNAQAEAVESMVAMQSLVGSLFDKADDAVSKIGRNLAKSPVMLTNYSASIFSVIEAFTDEMVDKLYDDIGKNRNDPVVLEALFNNLNKLLGTTNIKLNPGNALEATLSRADLKKFKDRIALVYGSNLRGSIESTYGNLTVNREALIDATQVAFEIFNAIYEDALTQAISENNGKQLSKEQLKKLLSDLAYAQPMINTPMAGKNETNSGILAVKKDKTRYEDTPQNQQFKQVSKIGGTKNEGGVAQRSLTSFINKDTFVEPGVSPMVLLTHSFDGATQLRLMELFEVLNVHDASGQALTQSDEISQAANQIFMDLLTEFDFITEVNNMVDRSLAAIDKYDSNQDSDLRVKIQNTLEAAEIFNESNFKDSFETFKTQFNEQMVQPQELKQEMLDKVESLGQFNNAKNNTQISNTESTKSELSEEEEGQKLVGDIVNMVNESIPNPEVQTTESVDEQQVDQKQRYDSLVKYEQGLRTELDKVDFGLSEETLTAKEAKRITNQIEGKQLLAFNMLQNMEQGMSFDKALTNVMLSTAVKKSVLNAFATDIQGNQEFGSGPVNINTDKFNADKTYKVTGQTVDQIFSDLGNIKYGNVQETTEHSNYLRKIINETISPVINDLVLKLKQAGDTTQGVLRDGTIFFISGVGAVANGIQMSAQETYAHELIHSVTAEELDKNGDITREVKRLFAHAEKFIKVEDFLNDSRDASNPIELVAAQERFDHIFNNRNQHQTVHIDPHTGEKYVISKNNYLHEFVALGTTNRNFIEALSKIPELPGRTVRADNIVDTLLNIIGELFDKLSRAISGRTIGNVTADKRLMLLANQLAQIDNKNKNAIARSFDAMKMLNDATITALRKFVMAPLTLLINSETVKGAKNKYVQRSGEFVRRISNSDFAQWSKAVKAVRRRQGAVSTNFLDSLASEAIGRTAKTAAWHALGSLSGKIVDKLRKEVATNASAQLLASFKSGEELTLKEKTAITTALLKTDASHLLGTFSWADIQKMFSDPKFLQTKIDDVKTGLTQFGTDHSIYYDKMSRSLANIMVEGVALEHQSMMNAHNIAKLYGTKRKPIGDVKVAEEIIDNLASLYAIQRTKLSAKADLVTVMEREFKTDGTNNGITFTAQMHLDNKKKSLNQLFQGQKALFVKGYTKEIYDPNVSFTIGTLAEEATLAKDSYVRNSTPIPRDATDPTQEDLYMYVSKNNMVSQFVSGISSNTNKKSKGADLIKVNSQVNSLDPALDAAIDGNLISRRKVLLVEKVFSQRDTTIRGDKSSLLVPLVNSKGAIAGYRYIMSESKKNNVLNKDSTFDNVLGAMEGSIKDKVNSEYINNRVVETAYDEFRSDFNKDREEFVFIGKDSTNSKHKEIYQLMPQAMRDEIRRVWGKNGMWIRDNVVVQVFGQRKYSVVDSFNSKKTNTAVDDVMGVIAQGLAKVIGNPKVKTAENVWQAVIKIVKDTIVIKTGVVLAGNILSNMILLSMAGVPIKDIARNHIIAWKASRDYQKDLTDLDRLERQLRINPNLSNRKSIELKVIRLKDAIANNPVRELNEAGVYQTILEDIDAENENFTFKSKLDDWVDPISSKIHPALKTIGKNMFMTHDTAAYKFMRDATQLSDFIARFTMHEHNTKVKKLKQKESIDMIIDSFINYDLPTHKGIQYANDMGLVMFTKFFIRIQRVLFHTAKGNPGRVLAWLMLQNMTGDVSDVFDTNFITGPVLDRVNVDPIELALQASNTPILELMKDQL